MQSWMRRFIAPPVFEGDEDKTRVAGMLNTILLTVIAVTVLVSFTLWVLALVPVFALVAFSIMPLAEIGLLLLMRHGHVRLASGLLVSVLGVFFTANTIVYGGTGNTFSTFVVVVLVAGLMVGGWAGLIFAGVGAAAGLGLVLMGNAGMLPPASAPITPVFLWAGNTATFILAAVLVQLANRGVFGALERARQSNRELQAIRASLEERVEERTRDLARRARYLESTAAVAREVASVLNLEELLSRVVVLISEQFGFYHTGVFLLDSTREWAVLQAASSDGGKRMLERQHHLQVGKQGIVGHVTGRGESHIALDVGTDAVFFNNPDLPDTRSEMALPLRARGQIIGALDVQSTLPEAFGQEDVATLQTLADQVAMAINNAQLFQQAQEGMEAERKAYGELSREAWINLLRTRSDLGYRYEQQEVVPVGNVVAETVPPDDKLPELTLPVKYRGQTLGTIVAHKGTDAREWTSEETALMETLSDQLSTALDSARLYQDTQRRAARERLAGEVTARMRETLDIDIVLQTAVREMRAALGLAEVEVQLGIGGTSGDTEA